MSSLLGEIGLSEQLLLSYIIGIAGAPAVYPGVRSLENLAWQANPVMPPNAYVLAEGVAQGQVDRRTAAAWALSQGISGDAFTALVDVANTGPSLGYAFEAWRRGQLTETEFETALRRTGLETQWFGALKALKHDRLDLGAIATAVHRGIMKDAGLLVQTVPTGSGNVPRIPVSPLDTLAEFEAQGIDPERARVLVADTGLPLSLGEMLQLYNRGKVTETDVKVSIAESNVRNEYMDVALDLARRLLTPHEYGEAELRGVMTRAEAEHGAHLSGLDPADYVTLFEILGRPLAVSQITTGLARGGDFGGTYNDVPEPYRDAIRRSAIRPEYARLAYANRWRLPSGFQIRSEAQAGNVTEAQTKDLLLESGWQPKWADHFSASWTGGATSTADPHIVKAENQLWTTLHRSYVSAETDDATATATLPLAGAAADSVAGVLRRWQAERELIRKQLTPAQIKKAYAKAAVNAATNEPWTRDEALAALIERGYASEQALSYLNI